MGPPICWLASSASDGITDQRVVATDFADHPLPDHRSPRKPAPQ